MQVRQVTGPKQSITAALRSPVIALCSEQAQMALWLPPRRRGCFTHSTSQQLSVSEEAHTAARMGMQNTQRPGSMLHAPASRNAPASPHFCPHTWYSWPLGSSVTSRLVNLASIPYSVSAAHCSMPLYMHSTMA